MKEFMLAVMAHNLTEPLQRTKMLLNIMEEYLPKEKGHDARQIFQMLLKCHRLASEINNFFVKQELLGTGQVTTDLRKGMLSILTHPYFSKNRIVFSKMAKKQHGR